MKAYFHVFITHETKLFVQSIDGKEFFVPATAILTADPYDEAIIKHVHHTTGLTVFIGKPFFLRDSMIKGERFLEVFVTATAGGEETTLDETKAKWISPDLYETEDIAEHLHKAFEVFLEEYKL
jgi:hypothetical protein